ncbi:hypothetical protein OSB04_022853 [Centaurea solstitialis]|uniref:DUF4378 domain-containing protein n=1 Tax=Centaurea solstitialis TaxID=347529 RepID=A0AA38SUW0_9ASTR|nr:hypothetical protein OSB04_022853 [Centaurea solstitialis]
MGLDSFPNPTTSTKPTRVSLGSIMRSKSASSVDFLSNFEIVKHRRVRTSVSFREQVHTFLEASHYNHNLGNLENLERLERLEMENLRWVGNAKSEVGFASNQEKLKISKKGMRGEQEQDKKKKKKDQKNKEEVSSSMKLKYRRKRVGFQEEEKGYQSRKRTYNHPLPKKVKHDRRLVKKQTILKRRESEYSEEYCMKVVVDVFRLTMEEINEGVWMDKKVDSYNLQEVSYEVGQEILQLLVYEMVDELCNSY